MNTLGVILARGASKRMPRKCLRPLAGIPLVAWTCRAARASKIGRVVLSTEDDEIAAVGLAEGIEVPFKRPPELAEDFARDVDIVLHAVDVAQARFGERYDAVVMIQATTPFTRPKDLDACVDRLAGGGCACVFTARKAEDHPRWTWTIDAAGHARPYLGEALLADQQHSQNLPPAYYPTGGAYAIVVDELRRQDAIYCHPLGLVDTPWQFSADIDDERDWLIAEAVVRHYGIAPVPAPTAAQGAAT